MEENIVRKLSFMSISTNVVLSLFKLIAGFIGHSSVMISDAVHSMSDVFATLIAFVGVKISQKSPDEKHPYGYERLECLASIFLGMVLLGTGVTIGFSGIHSIITGEYRQLAEPGMIALLAAGVSIVVKEGMFHYIRHYALILHSSVFMADAWNHRSDALSSIGALIGIGGSILGFKILDPLASILLCGFIGKMCFTIFRDAFNNLIDTSCDKKYEQELETYIISREGVDHLDMLKTRMFGNKIYIDTEIAVDSELSLKEAHKIAEDVHTSVEKKFSNVKHITIEVNPED